MQQNAFKSNNKQNESQTLLTQVKFNEGSKAQKVIVKINE